MRDILSYLWQSCGFLYSFLFVVSFLALFVGGMVILFRARSRKAALIYVVLTFVPLLIGVLGTVQGYLSVMFLGLPVEQLDIAYHISWVTTYVGSSITLPYLMLGLVAFLTLSQDRFAKHKYLHGS